MCIRDSTNIVAMLLGVEGIDVNAAANTGMTALMYASRSGHTAIVTTLLAVDGINIAAETRQGATALNLANREGHDEIVACLRRAGARWGGEGVSK